MFYAGWNYGVRMELVGIYKQDTEVLVRQSVPPEDYIKNISAAGGNSMRIWVRDGDRARAAPVPAPAPSPMPSSPAHPRAPPPTRAPAPFPPHCDIATRPACRPGYHFWPCRLEGVCKTNLFV